MERTMKAFLLLRLLTIAVITTSIGSCNANLGVPCRESEKQALLIFKKHLTDPSNRLSSWVAKEDSNCCRWAGVVCDYSTGHVHQLHLGNPAVPYDYYYVGTGGESSNASLGGKISPSLLNLTHLTYLNLSRNNFQGRKIPAFFGSLKSLTHLDISVANFGRTIPHQLGNLSSLSHLFLYDVYTSSLRVENLQWVSGLSQLEHLDMRGVDLSKASDHWLLVTNMLPSLVKLSMSHCQLDSFPLPPIINFTSLSILDLSGNKFDSLFPGRVFSLRSLVSLHLGDCGLLGPLPSSPHNVTSLRDIDLSFNGLNHSIPEWLYSFHNLESLDLHYNNFQGEISSSIGNLTSIINLYLGRNLLEGKILNSLRNLCKLMVLDLSENQFTIERLSEIFRILSVCGSNRIESLSFRSLNLSGQLTEDIGSFTNLSWLDVSNNSLSGPIPMSLGNLSRLERLYISSNNFDGSLPESIGQLKMLTRLDISDNSFKGVVSEAHFTHLTRLNVISARGNSLTLVTRPDWLPPFQLEYLDLGSWHLGSELPKWLQTQRQLSELSLSNTGISGTIPNWVLNMSFQYLNLSHNHLSGEIEDINGLDIGSVIDISSNQFNGSLPRVSSTVLVLDLSKSSFSGSVSHFFCHKIPHRLTMLRVGNNLLSGKIPDCWRNWQELEFMDLGNNNFTGNIPKSIGHLVKLESLHLHNNHLSGPFPPSMQKCTSLSVLEIAGNRLVGSLPIWIGSLLNLKVVNLRSNELQGVIPPELCNLTHLQILDLADNILSGTIPRCFCNFTAMVNFSKLEPVISFSSFYFYGPMSEIYMDNALLVTKGRADEYRNILGLVTSIDLSKNSISGEVPEELTNLIGLRYLNLSENLLTGKIPSKIGKMVQLESLDLSKNQLYGEIPASMKSMTFLNRLNLSYNNLTGRIPESPQLQSLDQSGFLGNKLCGPPLTKNCSESKVIPPSTKQDRGYYMLNDKWFYLSLGLGFAVGFWSILGSLLLNLPWNAAFSRFLNRLVLKIYGTIVEHV